MGWWEKLNGIPTFGNLILSKFQVRKEGVQQPRSQFLRNASRKDNQITSSMAKVTSQNRKNTTSTAAKTEMKGTKITLFWLELAEKERNLDGIWSP